MKSTVADVCLDKDLSQPEPIPEEAIARAVEIMRGGRLHRYGEQGAGHAEVSLLEQDYAAYVGSRYCVALSSCGAAMLIAMKALGVRPEDRVLTSSFTLSPVPGAIAHAGALPVLVETAEDYTTDMADLAIKAERSGAKVFLMSHMRGHIGDLRATRSLCDEMGVQLVEDCAHTMGARWDGRYTGTWGQVGCFSTQTYKHINAGEGGLLVTDDADVAAQAILMSGSYMLYGQHIVKPDNEVFERWKYVTPNFSMRMSNLAAALLRPQLGLLAQRATTWNGLYGLLAAELAKIDYVSLPRRDAREEFVASSIQFSLALEPSRIEVFLQACARRGAFIKWFGAQQPAGFTSNASHWHYVPERPDAPGTIVGHLCDMRISTFLTAQDCKLIGEIIAASVALASAA